MHFSDTQLILVPSNIELLDAESAHFYELKQSFEAISSSRIDQTQAESLFSQNGLAALHL